MGGAVAISNDYEIFAKQVGFLLNSAFDRERIGSRGSKRMGPEGGSQAIALSILTHLNQCL